MSNMKSSMNSHELNTLVSAHNIEPHSTQPQLLLPKQQAIDKANITIKESERNKGGINDVTGSKIFSKQKVPERVDQKLDIQGSIFTGRDEAQILRNKIKNQQEEMKAALEKQILEKKRNKDEEKRLQLEQDKIDEQRIQNQIEKEKSLANESKPLDPQFRQSSNPAF